MRPRTGPGIGHRAAPVLAGLTVAAVSMVGQVVETGTTTAPGIRGHGWAAEWWSGSGGSSVTHSKGARVIEMY
ncbi:hypothetical protein GCM10007964_44290 [Sphaerisporangium melleum]|uniref:Uncharacterized protein n=1 Tax=Sphaerisporangium melleum TaxID=321316 RepID=A0A917R9I0_9ACTN|nr:hypothetical protein GCM10007964_44290 [Sphaerisporangium melleum]